jgi:hypothetical protein
MFELIKKSIDNLNQKWYDKNIEKIN